MGIQACIVLLGTVPIGFLFSVQGPMQRSLNGAGTAALAGRWEVGALVGVIFLE